MVKNKDHDLAVLGAVDGVARGNTNLSPLIACSVSRLHKERETLCSGDDRGCHHGANYKYALEVFDVPSSAWCYSVELCYKS